MVVATGIMRAQDPGGGAGEKAAQAPVQLAHFTASKAPSLNILRAARRRNPRDPDTHTQLARALMDQPEHRNEVIGLAEQAAALDPGNAARWSFVAVAYNNAHKPQGAIEAATKAIALEPKNALAHMVRGFAREAIEDLVGAIEDFAAAAELDPSKPEYHFHMGRIFGKREDWGDSVTALTRAIKLGWKGRNAHDMLINALSKGGDTGRALAVLDNLIEEGPKDARAWAARGDYHAFKSEFERALPDYSRASELEPSSNLLLNSKGWALSRLGRVAEAVACFDMVIARDPDNAFAHSERAYMKERLGLFRQAADDLDRAVELEPKFPGYLRSRGIAHFAAGDFREALDDLARFNSRKDEAEDYPWFLIYLLQWRIDGTRDTTHVSEVALNAKEPWTRTVATFLLGQISEAEFIASAGSGDDEQARGERCEAYFYSGIVRSLRGENGVRELMTKCIAVEKLDFVEYDLARGELQRMDARGGAQN